MRETYFGYLLRSIRYSNFYVEIPERDVIFRGPGVEVTDFLTIQFSQGLVLVLEHSS
jgi:hypothetical protein